MLSDSPQDSWHIGWFPCKDVPILEQEVDELVLLLVGKAATDSNGLAGIFRVDLYHLGVFSVLEGPADYFLVLDSGATSVIVAWIVHSPEAWLMAAVMLRFSSS